MARVKHFQLANEIRVELSRRKIGWRICAETAKCMTVAADTHCPFDSRPATDKTNKLDKKREARTESCRPISFQSLALSGDEVTPGFDRLLSVELRIFLSPRFVL